MDLVRRSGDQAPVETGDGKITYPPEIELLLFCARAQISDRAVARVRELLDNGIDWDYFETTASCHGVVPLVYACLSGKFPDLVPRKALTSLRESFRGSASRSLFLTGKLLWLLKLFQASQIPVIPLKGPVLAASLYADPALRRFIDLDLLVHKRDVPRIMQLMAAHGFSLDSHLAWAPQKTLIDWNYELSYSQSETRVDLHWEIASSDYPFRFDPEVLWSDERSVRIEGRDVPSLSPENLLLFLCVHGAKHLWINLQLICDVARLIETSPETDWAKALDHARELGCEHVVLLGLFLANDLLQAPLAPEVMRRVEADRVIQPLAEQVKRHLLVKSPAAPESLELVMFNIKMADRLWAKVRHLAALLRGPTEADAQLLHLPPMLFFLYYPFRFWRMAVKYGLRLRH